MSMEKAKLTPKSRVYDDADEEGRTDKSAKDVPGLDGSNLVIPTPLPRSKSASQSSLSSSEPLPSAHNDDSVANSCDPEMADPMDLDDTNSGRNVILDTSRASWNQPLGLIATPQSPKSSPSKSDSGDHGHVQKKRKSDIGLVPSQVDISMNCQSEGENPDCDRTNRKKERMPSQTFPSKKSGMRSAAPQKAQKDLRQNLRNHIVGFARTGSQIPVVPEKSDLSEEDEDEDEDEDVDQLLSDAEVPCDLPTHRSTDLASASVTGPDMVIDPVQVSGPSVKTSVLNSVDLTLDEDDDVDDPASLLSQARASSLATSSSVSPADKVIRPEIIRSETIGPDISLKFNIDRVKQAWAVRPKESQGGKQRKSTLDEVLVDAGVANTEKDEKAVDALSRVIEKDDFAMMDIVGQFNLGFIVVRLRKTIAINDSGDPDEMDDLFIVDQHAADEKYNFETLQSTTVIQSQKLLM
jgi:DNA mismatch repair protein PMS2